MVDLMFILLGAWGRRGQSCCPAVREGFTGSSCSWRENNHEMLLLLKHFGPVLHGNRAIEKKRSLHMSQDINLIYTTVRRIHGDCCGLCKKGDKLCMHQSNDLLCFSHWFCRLRFLSSLLRTLELSKTSVPFCCDLSKGFFPFLFKICGREVGNEHPNQQSLTASFRFLPGWIPGLFLHWATQTVFQWTVWQTNCRNVLHYFISKFAYVYFCRSWKYGAYPKNQC